MRPLLLCLGLMSVPLHAQMPLQDTKLCAEIRTLTETSSAHWGVSVATLEGTPICSIEAVRLFRPASNAKLFTLAAALALFSPNRSLETKVTGKLYEKTGAVTGDLTLTGGGDANLDSGDLPYQPDSKLRPPFTFHDLNELAEQLVKAGVKSVAGDLVGDDTLFPYEPYGASWELDDLVWGYGAPVSALTIADNQLRLTITPGLTGKPATVVLDQHGVAYYRVDANVMTVPKKTEGIGVQVERLPGSRVLRVFGTIADDAVPDVEEVAIDDPAEYAALAFREALQAHGISVAGKLRVEHRAVESGASFLSQLRKPGNLGETECAERVPAPTLAIHLSLPLAADVVYTNKVSQNLHAELLLHNIGTYLLCNNGSTLAGARRVRAFLLEAGIAESDFLFYDGSGLSSHDLVTPRAVTRLLSYAATQKWFPDFKASLPIGGVDGSLEKRFTGPLKGRVFAKTGSLGESRALSGYVVGNSGKMLVFSILDDNHLPGSTVDRALMGRIVERIASSN